MQEDEEEEKKKRGDETCAARKLSWVKRQRPWDVCRLKILPKMKTFERSILVGAPQMALMATFFFPDSPVAWAEESTVHKIRYHIQRQFLFPCEVTCFLRHDLGMTLATASPPPRRSSRETKTETAHLMSISKRCRKEFCAQSTQVDC